MREFLRNNKIKLSLMQRHRMIEINENFLIKVLKLKQHRLINDLKFANFNIYHNKNFKKFKD